MDKPTNAYISADRPIDSRSEDRLGRTAFAEQLAKVVHQWTGKDSLVIGLYGPWGSGKTSIKNLVIETLRSHREKPHILEFNPWQWVGHSKLTDAFFREVYLQLGEDIADERAAKVARQLKAYGRFLSAGETVFVAAPKITIALLALALALGLSPTVVNGLARYSEVIYPIAFAAACITALLTVLSGILKSISQWLEARVEANQVSFAERKRVLQAALRHLKRPFLIVIDDLDRLDTANIQEVFQLVKANADFPNFVYLLPFQRSTVSDSIAPPGGEGDAALDKLVQVGFDVPPATRSALTAVLSENLSSIFTGSSAKHFSDTRWRSLYEGGLDFYLSHLRVTKRFIGTLSVYVEVFRRGNILEVNPIDLIGIEALRVFEPTLYSQVIISKDLLLSDRSSESGQRTKIKEPVLRLLNDLPEQRRAAAQTLVAALFPNLNWIFGGFQQSGSAEEWLRDLRVCSPANFDRYFRLSISEGEVSQVEVERLLDLASNDQAAFALDLKRAAESKRIADILDVVGVRVAEIGRAGVPLVVLAVADTGRYIRDEDSDMFAFPTRWLLDSFIRRLLLTVELENDRFAALQYAIERTTCLSVITGVLYGEERRTAGIDGATGPFLFAPEGGQLATLTRRATERIRELAKTDRLLQESELAFVLYRWQAWSSIDEVRNWIEHVIETPASALVLLESFIHTSRRLDADGKVTIGWFLRPDELGKFVDLYRIRDAVAPLGAFPKDDDAQRALAALSRAIAAPAGDRDGENV